MINKKALRPVEFPGLVRLGNRTGDGGYVVPLPLVASAHSMLSLGLAEEWTFDLDALMHNPRLRVLGVDHTIHPSRFLRYVLRGTIKSALYGMVGNRSKKQQYQRLRDLGRAYFRLFTQPSEHIRKMVAKTDSATTISVTSLVNMVQPASAHSLVVKMDIESSEYEVIDQIVECAQSISVLTGEFHDLVTHTNRFNDAMEKLLETFAIVHIHGNNYGAFCEENNFPDTVEITFVHRALLPEGAEVSSHTYPRPALDVPNKAGVPDYPLVFD